MPPAGFPSPFIGAYAGDATKGSNLPEQVPQIQSPPTLFRYGSPALSRLRSADCGSSVSMAWRLMGS